MLNLEQAMKLAKDLYGSKPKVSYDGKDFSFSCNHTYFTGETIDEITSQLETQLFESWKSRVLRTETALEKTSTEVAENSATGYVQVVSASNTGETLKTRKEWSVGKKGDPRRKRKGFPMPFTKTQVLEFMRKATNGRFSSELVSFEQYVKEFTSEYRKAKGRRNWHANKHKYGERRKAYAERQRQII
jgi:hypothetical protein